MSPDASGRFRGIVVSHVPWHEKPADDEFVEADIVTIAGNELAVIAERQAPVDIANVLERN